MKQLPGIFQFATSWLFLSTCLCASDLFVSPNGNDANPGTTDQPFATLERARDAARQSKGSTVNLAAGTYRFSKTLELDQRDSGTIYRAQPGAPVRLAGSLLVQGSAVEPVTDRAILERLLPEVRSKVKQIDLHQLGITDFGEIGPRGFARPYISAPVELFVDDAPLTLAQWPKPGQPGVKIGKVIDKGSVPSPSIFTAIRPLTGKPEPARGLCTARFITSAQAGFRWAAAIARRFNPPGILSRTATSIM